MDRETARKYLTSITDDEARVKETCRIEADYHLGIAIDHLIIAKTGRMPEKEVAWRLKEAIQHLVYDS